MKKSTYILTPLFFLCTALLILGNSSCGNSAADVKSDSLSDSTAAEPINVPSTHVFISLPKGFSIAKDFIGLEKDAQTGMNIMELDGGNFYTNAATFSAETFRMQGINVVEYEELEIDGYPAKLALLQSQPGEQSYQLVFGDSTFSVAVMGLFQSNNEEDKKSIRLALNTISYDKSLKIDYMADAPFTINDTISKFRFFSAGGGVYMFAPVGTTNGSKDRPMFTVLPAPVSANASAKIIAGQMAASLQKNGMENMITKNESSANVNGYDAYERELHTTSNGKETIIYQLVLVSVSKAIVLQGVSLSASDEDLKEFKKIAHTVRMKEN